MEDASNTVQILVACAMKGIQFSSINYLQWGGTKEMGSQMKACAIHSIRFTRMNCLWLGNTKETSSQMKVCAIYFIRFTRMNWLWLSNTKRNGQPDQGVCDIRHAVHSDELFAWHKRTETVQLNKTCVLFDGIACGSLGPCHQCVTSVATIRSPGASSYTVATVHRLFAFPSRFGTVVAR